MKNMIKMIEPNLTLKYEKLYKNMNLSMLEMELKHLKFHLKEHINNIRYVEKLIYEKMMSKN